MTTRQRRYSKTRRGGRFYTVGELNKLVDAFLHPLAEREPYFLIFDAILHAVVEQNPPDSLVKFLRFNFPKLIGQVIFNRDRPKQARD